MRKKMSELYKKLKRFHIQQDQPNGGSFAAFMVIRNALEGKRRTQKGVRTIMSSQVYGEFY